MDDLEQKLKAYYQHNYYFRPEAVTEELTRKLKALESSPEAARRPNRRYVLPVAAAAALALVIGGWFAWQRAVTPEPVQTPVAIQSGSSVETPSEPNKPTEKPQAGAEETKPKEENISEETVTLTDPTTPPKSDRETSAKSDAETPAKPKETTPEKPYETAPEKQEDTNPEKSEDTPSAKPESAAPPKPDESNPQGSEDIDLPDPAATDEDQTIVSMERPQISTSCRMEGGRETLTLTLLSTGESVNIDVTGLVPSNPVTQPDQEGPQSGSDGAAASQAGASHLYWGSCSAFGWQIMYVLARNSDNSISSQVVDMRQN
ncbi:MAG: hypothetical protein IKT99_05825 [Oscillospiraceae bacterium]|nr:hypothetical protein [Oscillospiraceae bacterium]